MAMALADLEVAINPLRQRVGLYLAGPRAQAHGAAELVNAAQLAQLIDDAVRGGLVELTRVGPFKAAHVARKLYARRLHAEADSEVRDFLLARIADRIQHAFDAALAEAAGDKDAVVIFELRVVLLAFLRLEALRFHPGNAQL